MLLRAIRAGEEPDFSEAAFFVAADRRSRLGIIPPGANCLFFSKQLC